MKKNKYKIIFFLILLIGIFLRIYKLYEIPKGIHIDEAGMFVDANMIAKFGIDRYNHSYPIYLQNFGGGQSVMYAYLTAILIKIFSPSYLLIRIPAVIFGILLIIFSYLIGKEFLSKKRSLLLMSLISFCPYFIQASRIGLDCNLFLPFFTISFYILIKAIQKQNNKLFFTSGVMHSLCLYTYALSYLIIPIFITLSLIYVKKNRKINKKNILSFLIPFIIISLPIILFLMVNYNVIPQFKLLKSDMFKLPLFRQSEVSIRNVLDNVLIPNILTFDYYEYNAKPFFGTIYYILIPFFIFGLIKYSKKIINNIKNNKFELENLIFYMFISCYMALLPIESLNINKANAIYFSIIYITLYGIINSQILIKKIIILLFIINVGIFSIYYYNTYQYDNFYFDDSIYKIVNNEYEKIKAKNIIVINDNIQPNIFVQLGKITKIKNKEEIIKNNGQNSTNSKNIYLVEEKYENSNYYSEYIKYNNYYLYMNNIKN